MNDLLKLLDGSADDVKTGLAGLSHDDLLKLRTAEKDGKARKGVLDMLDAAISAADAARSGGTVQMASTDANGVTNLDHSGPANIAAATSIDTAGAPQQIVPDVDMEHPAVDNDPRANTTETMNRIDFNDPHRSGSDVVTDALKAQPNG
jgi:hypothetical protein